LRATIIWHAERRPARREQVPQAGYRSDLQLVGRRGIQYCIHRGVEIQQDTPLRGPAGLRQDPPVGGPVDVRFLHGQIGGLEVAYMQYILSGQQKPVSRGYCR